METSENERVGAVRGHVEHDSLCQTPLSEHTGEEACLRWVEEEQPLLGGPMEFQGFLKRGPQGNMVYDFAGEFHARFGKAHDGPLGSPEIEDRRDASDPAEVGAAYLARNNGSPA